MELTNHKLTWLWRSRAKMLREAFYLCERKPELEYMIEMSKVYDQCANELRDPPADLLEKYDIETTKENPPARGQD